MHRSWAVAGVLNSDCYFAQPCTPCECSSNENTHGLIRQYFPKTYDLATIKTTQLARVLPSSMAGNSTTDHATVLA
ncbi:hypothetical protein [Candidatus Spongiihabitans sp.]|uniref:hypothetical protein n=1 Tax=Candidatus Spongiihabitans sp. TaxID=3101308 RepID=UPI003C7E9B6B